jgi:hypothetical protein
MWSPASRCVPHSVSSRERWRRGRAGPCWAVASLLLLSAGCSRSARAVRLPALSPGDEVYRISCKDSIRACRDEAAEVCSRGYEVLQSSGAAVQPERVSSAPGPASTGPKYQRSKWVGQMVVACSDAHDGNADRRAESPGEDPGGGGGKAGVTPSAPADRLCIPGVTQECLGPGACRGAQGCMADGNGYGPCDCGS